MIFISNTSEVDSLLKVSTLDLISYKINRATITTEFKLNEKIYLIDIQKDHIVIEDESQAKILTARLEQYLYNIENLTNKYISELTLICPYCLTTYKKSQTELFLKMHMHDDNYCCKICNNQIKYIIKELAINPKIPIIEQLNFKLKVDIYQETKNAIFLAYQYYDRKLKDLPPRNVSYWVPKSKIKIISRDRNHAEILMSFAIEEEKISIIISNNYFDKSVKIDKKSIFRKSKKWIIGFMIYALISIGVIFFAFYWYMRLINSLM